MPGWTIEDVAEIDRSGVAHVQAPSTAVPDFGFGFKSPPRPAIASLPAQYEAVELITAISVEARRLIGPSPELDLGR